MPSKRTTLWKAVVAAPSATGSADHKYFLAKAVAAPPSAVLVFHGVGEEVRFDTLSRTASLILAEAKERGAKEISVVVRAVPKDAHTFQYRSELSWTEIDGVARQVHVYEAYWAPLTVGKVSYIETVCFLAEAGWNGLCGTVFSGRIGSFQRWLFGGFKKMKTTAGTFPLLAVLMGMIGFLVAIVAVATYSFAQAAKLAAGGGREGLIAAANLIYYKAAAPWNLIVRLLAKILYYFAEFPEGQAFLVRMKFQPEITRGYLWQAVVALLLWALLIRLAFKMRFLLMQYAGSLVAYISPFKDSKFDDLRGRIQQVGLDAAQLIYDGHKLPSGWVPAYRRVVILGHSLGSVIAYDTLNAMMNLESARQPSGARNPVTARTGALITFGSPLDKTAFLFRVQLKVDPKHADQGGELREAMVCAVQPMISSYADARFNLAATPPGPQWINIWSPMDVVSGRLDYYDDPAVSEDAPQHVQNLIDPEAWIPVAAHTQYWDKKLLRKTVYDQLF